jgi:hypothetical protein
VRRCVARCSSCGCGETSQRLPVLLLVLVLIFCCSEFFVVGFVFFFYFFIFFLFRVRATCCELPAWRDECVVLHM